MYSRHEQRVVHKQDRGQVEEPSVLQVIPDINLRNVVIQ